MEKLIVWVDIPTVDFKRGVEFYSTILGIDLQVNDCGDEMMACFPSGEGAIISSPGYKPSHDGVLVSLNTGKELDSTIKKIEQNGGEIITPKTKIQVEGRGYFAVFRDCEGNRLGLYGDE